MDLTAAEIDDLLHHTTSALEGWVSKDADRVENALTAISVYGKAGWWGATCAWAEAIHQYTQDGTSRLNAFTVTTTNADTPVPADRVLAVQIVTCHGNGDGETALMLWSATDPETAQLASLFVLELAGELARQKLGE